MKTFSTILEYTTKHKTFSVTIELYDNDHSKEMLLCDAITDCLKLLVACIEILNFPQEVTSR